MLVTGFGPFLGHSDNPSALLAESCGAPFSVLEVSYRAVDAYLESLEAPETWLMLGLAAKAQSFLYETVGRNRIAAVPDVLDEVHGPGVIDPAGPPALAATLWHGRDVESEDVQSSVDAGGYMCNYLLYRGLAAFPSARLGFLHVPPVSVMSVERQLSVVRSVLERVS